MQNAMLDSTVSQLLQDNSFVEYADPQESPIAMIPTNELIFGQKHNDIDCALCPTAKRACDRAWFSAKQVENWSEMPKKTLWRWLERIEKAHRISRVSDMTHVDVSTSTGAVKTTFYNLNVMNQLAMACIDNEKLNEVSCKFSDFLSEKMTEGMSGTQPQPQTTLPMNYLDALKALVASEEAKLALQADLASEKEAHEKDNEDFRNGFDILNAQKAQIGSNREATAMATASAKSRECAKLTTENAKLKDAVGRGANWRTIAMMRAEWERKFGHAPSCHKLKEFSADLPKEMKPVKDVEVKVVLKNGSEKVNLLTRYHREAWAKYRKYEENSRVSAESRRDAKILDLKAANTEIEYF